MEYVQILWSVVLYLMQQMPTFLSNYAADKRIKDLKKDLASGNRPGVLLSMGTPMGERRRADPFDSIREGNGAIYEKGLPDLMLSLKGRPEKEFLYAAIMDDCEMLKRFIAQPPWPAGMNPAGATIRDAARSPAGVSALHAAALFNSLTAIKLLLAAGADPNANTRRGWTPVHVAISAHNNKAVDLLLYAGGDITAASRGWGALHVAAANNNMSVSKKVLEAGANHRAKNDEGKVAEDCIAGFGSRAWQQSFTKWMFLKWYESTVAKIAQRNAPEGDAP